LREAPGGPERVTAGLDVLFDQYSGRLFAVMVELSLTARDDSELRAVVAEEERSISRSMQETAATIFGSAFSETSEQATRWATALSAIRGLAMLKLLGHPAAGVDRQ
jgi:hypothetical protein